MPKSKVRKKPAAGRRKTATVTEAMTIPVWDYPGAAREMSRRLGDSEAACLAVLRAMPIRLWSAGASGIVQVWPPEEARTAGVTLDEYFESWRFLHEGGFMEWNAVNKAHYPSTPDKSRKPL